MYFKNKGSIAGPMFKLPFIGPFVQALYPDFEAYKKQWASGKLSCVSVFHKYISTPSRYQELIDHSQICRPHFRPRSGTQSLQLPRFRQAMRRPSCGRSYGSQCLGVPRRKAPHRLPQRVERPFYSQSARVLPPYSRERSF